MSSRSPRAILFDFDYTLGDSYIGILDAVQHAFDRLGLETPTDEDVHRSIGLPLQDMFHLFTGQAPSSSGAEAFKTHFIARADETMADKTHLYDHTRELLEHLHGENHRLGVVTTKYRRRIEGIMKRENLSHIFEIIVGGEDVTYQKPHPEALFTAAYGLSLEPDHCLYVGDSLTDARAARDAAMPFVAVLSGAHAPEDFHPFDPLHILPHAGHLPRRLFGE